MSQKDKQTVKDAESKCSTCSTKDGYFSCVSPCTQSWWYKQVKSINLSQECITDTLFSSIGYLLIGITMLNKVPQIIKIYKNKNAEGLLLSMFYIDLFMGINMILYYRHLGLSFNLYGEICMLWVQNIALIFMIREYNKETSSLIKLRDVVCIFGYMIFFSYATFLPDFIWKSLISSAALLNVSSKTPQIILNFRTKSTGQLSFQTWFISFFRNLWRLITIIQTTQNPYVIGNILLSVTEFFIFCAQIIFYNYVKKLFKKSK